MSLDKRETGEWMGRPLGALKGRTEEANEFARWLRRITTNVTVRSLEDDFPYGKSSWSGFRDGSRLPSPDLVKQVAERYLREPAMHARQLEQGLRLLTAAHQAAKDLEDRTAPSSQDLSALLAANRRVDPVTVALLRLDDARLRQIEAMQKLAASERRREELEAMVSVLEQRITIIESERDQARQETRAELQRELRMSLEYRRQADEKLAHARRAEDRARQLRLAAEKQVAAERAALMRLDRDAAADTLGPPIPTDSAIDGLHLPPLHHIRDLLDAAQEQLDAQDDELDVLGKQLGAEPGKDGYGESVVTQIVWGQVVDSGGPPAADVPPHALDNPRKPLTGHDGLATPKEIGPAASRKHAVDGRHAVSIELVVRLNAVDTADALSLSLSQLLRRTGVQSIGELSAALPDQMKDDVLRAAVGRWIDGDDVPATWSQLEELVRLMEATDDEVAAFRQAYQRITAKRSATWFNGEDDLAELVPFRATEWITAGMAPLALTGLTTAYTAALRAIPGPGAAKLVAYGVVFSIVCALILFAAVRVAVRSAWAEAASVRKRFTAAGLAASVLALPTGLVTPWLVDSDGPGRWLAELVQLL
ncbi:hypothetical protein ACIQJT_34910 [Streptomyces sp. NPDC091972]|uniref:hypothetical protein n=1 Tax=Streptomyces sp. NPDC091972 TaxID=3366007 RepID=UPI0038015783